MKKGGVEWRAWPGTGQTLFLACPIYEVLFEGTRGPGKTDALALDFARDCGKGHGAHWRGILFRRTYKELADIVKKTRRLFRITHPGARFLSAGSAFLWKWPDGEELLLRHFNTPDDYWSHHGHEYPWIGWEELTTWANLEGYNAMKSTNRTSIPGVPVRIRATANPFGVGHNAVREYFVTPAPAGVPIPNGDGTYRVRITGHWSENRALMAADPGYPHRLLADPNRNRRLAWYAGRWDITAGGMWDDLWSERVHVLKGKDAWAPAATPESWRIDRAFDWGSAKPFSVGWWAESDGTQAPNGRYYPARTLIRIAEWYGWNGQANEGLYLTSSQIADGIVERERAMGIRGRVRTGPADASIWTAEPGRESIGDVLTKAGAPFYPADKTSGSRRVQWQAIRDRLFEATKDKPEGPLLLCMETCRDGFLRTFPAAPRSKKDPEDVDTEAEDHAVDETGYRVNDRPGRAKASTGGRV